jgi:imidazolonepropionase-like amidohydrolase
MRRTRPPNAGARRENDLKRITVSLALLLLLGIVGRGRQIETTKPIVFQNVAVIDPLTGRARPSMTVVVEGTRITDVGPASLRPPDDSRVIDASGKFLMPGLWDMHTHGVGIPGIRDFSGPLLIANGVTGIRNLGQDRLSDILARREDIAAGKAVGPRIFTSGQIVDGPRPVWGFAVPVGSPEAARSAVDQQKLDHADFIKIYSLLPRREFFAVAQEAKTQNIPLVGHVPLAVSATEASNAGMKSMEHLHGTYLEASSEANALASRSMSYVQQVTDVSRAAQGEGAGGLAGFVRLEIEATLTYDHMRAERLFRTFKKNHTWQVPTLVAKQDWAYDDDPSQLADPRFKHLPYLERPTISTVLTHDEMSRLKQAFQIDLKIVRDMHKAGVPLLAGTDGPPFWLPDELALFVKAGLTAADVLRIATWNPAVFLDRTSDFGTVAKGKVADLVLLDSNPLIDIDAVRKIDTVLSNGRCFTRADLNAILTDLATRASAYKGQK